MVRCPPLSREMGIRDGQILLLYSGSMGPFGVLGAVSGVQRELSRELLCLYPQLPLTKDFLID
jgi:hypothetical protein